jgi:uncharacterized protein
VAPVSPARGPLVETFIVNELAKQATWSDHEVRLHHWRISGGAEGDLIVENEDGRIVAIESKSADIVTADDFRGLARCATFSVHSSCKESSCTLVVRAPQASATD